MAPAALALAGCDEAADSTSNGAPETPSRETQSTPKPDSTPTGTDITLGESGWLSIGSDGAVQTTFFDTGGRYRDLRNGELFAEGGWEQRPDGRVCFEPDSGRGDCWTIAEPDAGGEAIATNDEEKAITIRRITYIAPPDGENDEGMGS